MTIDQLAVWAALPTRTLREYRTLGLLPAPLRQGRVGMYDDTHRRRIELIRRLASRGYSLAGIADLLDAWAQGRSLLGVFERDDALTGPMDERPRRYEPAALAAAVALPDPSAIPDALGANGIAEPVADGWVVRSPAFIALVGEIAAVAGAEVAVDTARRLNAAIAEAARVGAGALLAAHAQGGVGDDDLLRLVRRARPLAAQAAASLFVHHLGEHLLADPGVAPFVEQVRIGAAGVEPVTPAGTFDPVDPAAVGPTMGS